MDQIYLWIIILFAVILILDYSERFMKKSKKENFDNQSDPKKSLPIYYEENRLNVYEPPYSTNAININRGQHANFSNFGTNGVTPPFLNAHHAPYNLTVPIIHMMSTIKTEMYAQNAMKRSSSTIIICQYIQEQPVNHEFAKI